MKVIVFGKNKGKIEPAVRAAGFTIVEEDPQFVVTYGGDGTLMRAEHAHPGIPKIVLKDSLICKKCSRITNEEVLALVRRDRYTIEELMKLEVTAQGKTLYAMNDIALHNEDARHAIRYTVSVNGKPIGGTIIGDGVVVSTPFGSTAYYRSITDSFFEVGMGLAFNNSTEQSDHMVLKENSEIALKILRGPAVLYADNQKDTILVDRDAEVVFRRSSHTARVVIPTIA
ncbi:NAD(+)/NADH kinase [Patescibacteria group bacterium]|nr:NAD(+)/NADH kinase [Patescibacteria group bacterium]